MKNKLSVYNRIIPNSALFIVLHRTSKHSHIIFTDNILIQAAADTLRVSHHPFKITLKKGICSKIRNNLIRNHLQFTENSYLCTYYLK